MVCKTFIVCLVCCTTLAQAQGEFPKGWVLNLEVSQGLTTQFNDQPDLYLADLRLDPQYTIIEHVLRAGLVPAVFYNDKKVSFALGPQLALNIKTIALPELNSSLANLQWVVEHLWGTNQQRLLGTGFRLEVGQTLLFSVLGHRDYNLGYWRLQLGIGYNFIYHPVPRPNVD